jgi:hypothetical protein
MMQTNEEESKDSGLENTLDFYAPIEKAYEWSSKQLLDLLFGEL